MHNILIFLTRYICGDKFINKEFVNNFFFSSLFLARVNLMNDSLLFEHTLKYT